MIGTTFGKPFSKFHIPCCHANLESVWDWETQKPINHFSNGNTEGGAVTTLRLINEDDHAFLLTGSVDGAVRIFKHYEDGKNTQVLTAFNALPKPDPITNNHSLVLDWIQGRGWILGAGDAKSIRVWSAHTELLDHVCFFSNTLFNSRLFSN